MILQDCAKKQRNLIDRNERKRNLFAVDKLGKSSEELWLEQAARCPSFLSIHDNICLSTSTNKLPLDPKGASLEVPPLFFLSRDEIPLDLNLPKSLCFEVHNSSWIKKKDVIIKERSIKFTLQITVEAVNN